MAILEPYCEFDIDRGPLKKEIFIADPRMVER